MSELKKLVEKIPKYVQVAMGVKKTCESAMSLLSLPRGTKPSVVKTFVDKIRMALAAGPGAVDLFADDVVVDLFADEVARQKECQMQSWATWEESKITALKSKILEKKSRSNERRINTGVLIAVAQQVPRHVAQAVGMEELLQRMFRGSSHPDKQLRHRVAMYWMDDILQLAERALE